jgi:hypothetical protein
LFVSTMYLVYNSFSSICFQRIFGRFLFWH